jgi:hypothetical protein
MKKVVVVAVMLLGIAWAQEWPVYSFQTETNASASEPNVLEISCQPYRTEGGIGTLLFMCEARALKGYPLFAPEFMDYVVGGYQYSITTDDYQFVGPMKVGNIHEGAAVQFRLLPEFMREDEPISLYYHREGVTIPLPELLGN